MKIVIPIDREENEPRVVIRGGSWFPYPYGLQASYRGNYGSSGRINDIGFRLVKKK